MSKTEWYCIFCDARVPNGSHCVPCLEYKGVVTLAEYIQMNGHYPKSMKG